MAMAAVWLTRLECAPGGGYWLAFSAEDTEAFYATGAALKECVPYGARKWEPNAPSGRAWWIAAAYLPRLADLFDNWAEMYAAATGAASGSGAKGKRRRTRTQGQPGRRKGIEPAEVVDAFAHLCLTPDAPEGLVNAARRWWAKQLHPDYGGSLQHMQRLNDKADVAEEWAKAHGQSRGAA